MNGQDNSERSNAVMSNDITIENSNLNSYHSSLPMPLPSNAVPIEEEINTSWSSSSSQANDANLNSNEI